MFLLRTDTLNGILPEAQGAALAALLFALVAAGFDLRRRSVPLWLILTETAVGVVFSILAGRDPVTVLTAMIPGMLLLLMCLLTGGIGIGDALFTLGLAAFFSVEAVGMILIFAFFLTALVSLGIIAAAGLRRHSCRGRSLPFLCFFPAGVLLWILNI